MGQHYLTPLFEARSVAVFGASDRSGAVGAVVYRNLIEGGYRGEVFPINPHQDTVAGNRAYPSLEALNRPVDLAVIATPAATVPAIIEACGRQGVRAAVILSAGFREVGDEGRRLEERTVENARAFGVRFIGPNCLGILRPDIGLNATFNTGSAKPGQLALVSQSGALCAAILDWAAANNVGFSSVVSTGISADLDFGEVLDYLVSDPKTRGILVYVEGIHHARSFVGALRAAARAKPVIVMKVGRFRSGSRAARSHTGALVGADDVFHAALRRAGVVRGMRFGDLFSAATTLTSRFKARGDRLAVITNGGGPGVMATDRAEDLGIPVAALSADSIARLDAVLPPTWSHANPVDLIGDAGPERYAEALKVCLADPGVDGVLVILTPVAMTAPMAVAEAVIALARDTTKPVITAWMGEVQVRAARDALRAAGLPSFYTPEAGVDAFRYLASHYRNQQLLLQVPGPIGRRHPSDRDGARLIIEGALAEGRKLLSETESKAVLAAFRIPTCEAVVVRSPTEALVQAESIGLPVALKINSPDITHKSDAGGVRLGISNAEAVRSAYRELIDEVRARRPEARIDGVTIEPMASSPHGRELLVGILSDPVFGPVIAFGAGGTAVEVINDRAVALPPLNRFLVKDLVGRTRIAKSLGAFRQMPPVDFDALEQAMLRISEIACELPWVRELEINPLLADDQGVLALDARILIDYPPATRGRYDHMAIHPYPSHLESTFQLPDGTGVVIRPIRPEDAEIEQAFVRGLSDRARYLRFMQTLTELTPDMLSRFTQIDYGRELALIAVVESGGRELQVAVARYATNPDATSCEFAIAVLDSWQHRGVGHRLMAQLIEAARAAGLVRMEGDVLTDNRSMLSLARSLGFALENAPGDPTLKRVSRRI